MNHIVNPEAAAWTIDTGWRYMFGSEAVPAGLFTILICFVPETPRYLVMTGRTDRARDILARIKGRLKADEIVEDIKNTLTEKTNGSWISYGCGIFVGIMLSVFQQTVGLMPLLYLPRALPRHAWLTDGTDSDMGCGNISFTWWRFHRGEMGAQALLIMVPRKWATAPWVWPSPWHRGFSMVSMLSFYGLFGSFCSRGDPSAGWLFAKSSTIPSGKGPWPLAVAVH